MEISRLIFSKETKQKINEDLNGNQKGILRWNKLKEAEEKGTLMLAKNRYEVANLVGYSEENKMRGYQWVSDKISGEHLRETMIGLGKNGKMEYEYHTISDPDYERKNARKAAHRAIQNAKKNIKETVAPKEVGKKQYDKLKELFESGKLAKAKSRAEVATLVGYDNDRAKQGYSWVSSLISRGYLKEEITGVNKSGKAITSYSLNGKTPMYDSEESRKKELNDAEVKDTEEKSIVITENKESETVSVIKMKISNGKVDIEVVVADSDQAIKLITTILKGE